MQQYSKLSSFKMQQNSFQDDFQDATKVKMGNFKNHFFVFYLSLVGWLLVVVPYCLSTFNHHRNGGRRSQRTTQKAEGESSQPKREERDRVKWCSIHLLLLGRWCWPPFSGRYFLVYYFFRWCCFPFPLDGAVAFPPLWDYLSF